MAQISYIGCSDFYTGNTNNYSYTYTDGGANIIQTGETAILFIVTTDISGSIVKPKDWETITSIGNSGGYMYSFWYQSSATTSSSPSWDFELQNNPFTKGFSIVFSGCTRNSNRLVHKYTQASNPPNQRYTNGFTTTINNTSIIHTVAVVSGSTPDISNWGSSPTLIWQHLLSGTTITGSTYVHISAGLSLNSSPQIYSQFTFEYNPDVNHSSLANVISLAPNIKTNQVLNLLQGFRGSGYVLP